VGDSDDRNLNKIIIKENTMTDDSTLLEFTGMTELIQIITKHIYIYVHHL
jgi:hypothetical protein